MNKARRELLDKAILNLWEARGTIATARGEEHEIFDNWPNSLQESDKGSQMKNTIVTLELAVDALDDVLYTLNNLIRV